MNDLDSEERLLKRKEVAHRANVSLGTLDAWVRGRVIPVISVGKRLKRFRWSDVRAALLNFERKEISRNSISAHTEPNTGPQLHRGECNPH
jgi:hypothetical protein